MEPSDPPVYRVGGWFSTAVAVTLWDGGVPDHMQATDRHFIDSVSRGERAKGKWNGKSFTERKKLTGG